MINQGWVSIYRKIQDHWIWKRNKPFDERSAWIDLILLVNHEDNKIIYDGKPLVVRRGQKVTSLQKLSKRWHWSIQKVKRFLLSLESDEMISLKIEPQKGTVVTIVNYGKYQDTNISKRNSTETETKQRRNRDETVPNINNNDNNDNNINNDDIEQYTSKINSLIVNQVSSSLIINFIDHYGLMSLELLIEQIPKSEYLIKNINFNHIEDKFLRKAIMGEYKTYNNKNLGDDEPNEYGKVPPLRF